jgi:hypothetical protein
MSKWQETIGEGFGTGKNKGQKRVHEVTDERDGSVGGKHIEHWDGSQDAVVSIKPIRAGASVNGKERD